MSASNFEWGTHRAVDKRRAKQHIQSMVALEIVGRVAGRNHRSLTPLPAGAAVVPHDKRHVELVCDQVVAEGCGGHSFDGGVHLQRAALPRCMGTLVQAVNGLSTNMVRCEHDW
jgi:hypothetical protein